MAPDLNQHTDKWRGLVKMRTMILKILYNVDGDCEENATRIELAYGLAATANVRLPDINSSHLCTSRMRPTVFLPLQTFCFLKTIQILRLASEISIELLIFQRFCCLKKNSRLLLPYALKKCYLGVVSELCICLTDTIVKSLSTSSLS